MKKYSDIINATERIRKDQSFYNIFCGQQSYSNVAFETFKNKKLVKLSYKKYTSLALQKAFSLSRQLRHYPNNTYILLKHANSIEWCVSFWALLIAGYNPVLVDNRFTVEEVEYAIGQTKATAIITNDNKKYSVPTLKCDLVQGTEYSINRETMGKKIVFCTSGTTEMFKMFEYDEKAICAQLLNSKEIVDNGFGFTQGNKNKLVKNLAILPFNHIFGFVALFMWYSALSGTIVFPEEATPESILETSRKLKVTHIFMVPAFWNRIVGNLKKKLEKGSDLEKKFVRNAIERGYDIQKHSDASSLKKAKANSKFVLKSIFGNNIEYLVSGGGYISDSTLKTLNSIGYPTYNGYGMTEAGIVCVENSDKISERIKGYIGKPFASCQTMISEEGELLLKGDSLHTAQIINGNHILRNRDAWFHTGDKVVCENGKYRIIGRIKELIIGQSGENINPNTLEVKFEKLPFVKNYCIIGVENKAKTSEEVTLVIQTNKQISKDDALTILEKVNSVNSNLQIYEKVVNVYQLRGHEDLFGLAKIPRLKVKKLFHDSPLSFFNLNSYQENHNKEIPEELRELSNEIKKIASEILSIPVEAINDNSDFINDLGGDSFCYVSLLLKVEEKYQIKLNDDYYTKCTNLYDLVTLTAKSIHDKNR